MLPMIARGKLYEIIEQDEGFRQFPYKDTKGLWTIGFGRNIEQRGISRGEAYGLLQNDVKDAASELVHAYPFAINLDDVRKTVLIAMWYNLGHEHISGFRNMWSALEKQDYALAAQEMRNSEWAKQVGARAERYAHWMEVGSFK